MNTFSAFGVLGSVLSILQILFLFDLHGYSIKVSNFQVSNVKLRHNLKMCPSLHCWLVTKPYVLNASLTFEIYKLSFGFPFSLKSASLLTLL